jgi:hypothetical protein
MEAENLPGLYNHDVIKNGSRRRRYTIWCRGERTVSCVSGNVEAPMEYWYD